VKLLLALIAIVLAAPLLVFVAVALGPIALVLLFIAFFAAVVMFLEHLGERHSS
jgi:hypothetical protein